MGAEEIAGIIGVAALALALAAGGAVIVLSRRRRRRELSSLARWLTRVPITPIASLEAGRAAVQGAVVAVARGTAPISGSEVVGCRIRIDQFQDISRGGTVIDRTASHDFIVDDGSGRALVRVEGAKMALERESEQRSGIWGCGAVPASVEALLDAHRVKRGVTDGQLFRWREYLLQEGEVAFVLGTCSDGAPAEGGAERVIAADFVADQPRDAFVAALGRNSDLPPNVLPRFGYDHEYLGSRERTFDDS